MDGDHDWTIEIDRFVAPDDNTRWVDSYSHLMLEQERRLQDGVVIVKVCYVEPSFTIYTLVLEVDFRPVVYLRARTVNCQLDRQRLCIVFPSQV